MHRWILSFLGISYSLPDYSILQQKAHWKYHHDLKPVQDSQCSWPTATEKDLLASGFVLQSSLLCILITCDAHIDYFTWVRNIRRKPCRNTNPALPAMQAIESRRMKRENEWLQKKNWSYWLKNANIAARFCIFQSHLGFSFLNTPT